MDNQSKLTLPSIPFRLKVKNFSETAQEVKLFDCNQIFDSSQRNTSIEIESGLPGLSYMEMYMYLVSNPCIVNGIYLYIRTKEPSASEQIYQHVSPLNIKQKNGKGTILTMPHVIGIDPYQFQNETFALNTSFLLNSLTTINFNLPARSELDICFFPGEELDQADLLFNNNLVRQYSNPTSFPCFMQFHPQNSPNPTCIKQDTPEPEVEPDDNNAADVPDFSNSESINVGSNGTLSSYPVPDDEVDQSFATQNSAPVSEDIPSELPKRNTRYEAIDTPFGGQEYVPVDNVVVMPIVEPKRRGRKKGSKNKTKSKK